MEKLFDRQSARMDTIEMRLQAEAEKSEQMLLRVQAEVEAMRVGNQKDTRRIEQGLCEVDTPMRSLEVGGNTPQSEKITTDIMDRIQKLESKPNDTTAPATSESTIWTPMHILVGGWHSCKRDVLEQQCEDLMRSQAPDVRAIIQRPFALRPVANIAKARGRQGELPRAQFALQTWLDDNCQKPLKDAHGVRWCAIERSPEAGRRRIILNDARHGRRQRRCRCGEIDARTNMLDADGCLDIGDVNAVAGSGGPPPDFRS